MRILSPSFIETITSLCENPNEEILHPQIVPCSDIRVCRGQYLRCLRDAVHALVEASLSLIVSGLVKPDVLLGECLKSTHCDAKNKKNET